MVNSSMKNAMARRNHKERSQPLHRQRLGLLEKHKDYVLRARDYHSKQDRLRKLKEKAAFRNKDEFYFGMIKAQTKGGVLVGDRGNVALGTDVVKVLKNQDLGWVRVQIAQDEKRVAKMRQELEVSAPAAGSDEWDAAAELAEVEKLAEMGVVLQPQPEASGSGSGSASARRKGKGKGRADEINGHVIFADGQDEFDGYSAAAPVETAEEATAEALDLGWETPAPRSRRKKPAKETDTGVGRVPGPSVDELLAEEVRQIRLDLLTSLSAHLARLKLLRQAESKLEQTKAQMGKGSVRKIRDHGWVEDETVPEDKNGERKRWVGKAFKWKAERKK